MATLRAVFEVAGTAPSNCNTQPWQIVVVSGNARDRLSAALLAAGHEERYSLDFEFDETSYAGVYGERRKAQGARYHESLGVAREDVAGRRAAVLNNLTFFGAPHVALLFMPSFGGVRVAADIGMYAQNLILSLAANGISSCPQTILGFFAEPIRSLFGISEDLKLLFGISFGYADESAPQNKFQIGKAPIEETTLFID